MFTAKELRDRWIWFFSSKGFFDVSDRSVIPPPSDKSLLFINSGVAAIKSYFCGDSSLPSNRLFSAQRVIRTGDIDEIGKSFRHHTYFEMLGNFSVGSVSRKEAINLAWEFLVDVLNMDSNKLYATVFEDDAESYRVWRTYLPEERIVKCGTDTNFWDMGVGPCGPCTEIYFDRGESYDPDGMGVELLSKGIDNGRFLEIWNLVFSDYLNVDGQIIDSPTKNLDTGAGLERLLVVLQNRENSFDTTLFAPIVDYLKGYVGDDVQKLWSSSDYFRTTCVLIRDGVDFGNKGREYVLRKVFRRACSCLSNQSLNRKFFEELVNVITSTLDYYDWNDVRGRIIDGMWQEYKLVFRNRQVSKILIDNLFDKYGSEIPAVEVFNLVTRDGISLDYLEHEIWESGRSFAREEYDKLFEEHKNKSFNEQISSAFVKPIPALMSDAEPTIFDYENAEVESDVSCLYVGDEFEKYEGPVDPHKNIYVVLKKTSVFPLSAGQDSDRGWMYLPNDEGKEEWVKIENSFKAVNGQILHKFAGLCESAQKKLGSFGSVKVIHDVDRRHKLEMNHTAEHLVYSILKRLINPEIIRVSGNKKEDIFSIEVQVPDGVGREDFDLLKINEELNSAVQKEMNVDISWGNMEKAKSMGIVGKFDEVYEMSKDNLRFVSLGEYGTELCIGTHVRNTREIEEALIVRFSKEQKNVYRFSVVTGKEAVRSALANFDSAKEYLWNLQHKEEIDRARKAEARSLFLSKKKELINELLGVEGRIKVLEKEVDVDLGMAAFKEIRGFFQEGVIMLFFRDGNSYRFFVASNGVDIGELFNVFRKKGGKCGGNSSFGSGMYEGEDFMEIFQSIIH